MNIISVDKLRYSFNYNPHTGTIVWANPTANRVKQGDIAGYEYKNKRNKYRYVRLAGKVFFAHRVAWAMHYGEWPKEQIDHIDRNGLNNKIENLRDVSQSINQLNRRLNKNSTSGIKGVTPIKNSKRWRARMQINGVRKDLGCFGTLEEAMSARRQAENKLLTLNIT